MFSTSPRWHGREETKGTRGEPSTELQQSARCQLCKTQGSLLFLVNVRLPPTIVQISPGCLARAFYRNTIPQLFFRHLLPGASSPSRELTRDSPSPPPLVGCTSTSEKLRKQLINEKYSLGRNKAL